MSRGNHSWTRWCAEAHTRVEHNSDAFYEDTGSEEARGHDIYANESFEEAVFSWHLSSYLYAVMFTHPSLYKP